MLTSMDAERLTFVYDPRGVDGAVAAPIAPRPKTLQGLRLGILDNSKWNANKLLRGASVALGKSVVFSDVRYYVKHSFSKDAAPELIRDIAQNSDIVLTAIGDCGSCTSCCIRDAIALEKLGIPTAAVVTTEFVRETELQRRALGMDDLLPVIIGHPVSSITNEEIAERVEQIRVQAPLVWLGQSSNSSVDRLTGPIPDSTLTAMFSYQDEEAALHAIAFAAGQL
jgi:hypothetical protein